MSMFQTIGEHGTHQANGPKCKNYAKLFRIDLLTSEDEDFSQSSTMMHLQKNKQLEQPLLERQRKRERQRQRDRERWGRERERVRERG